MDSVFCQNARIGNILSPRMKIPVHCESAFVHACIYVATVIGS